MDTIRKIAILAFTPAILFAAGCQGEGSTPDAMQETEDLGEASAALGELVCGTQTLVDIPGATPPSPPSTGSGWGRSIAAPVPPTLPWSAYTTPGSSNYALTHDCVNKWVTEVTGIQEYNFRPYSSSPILMPDTQAECEGWHHEAAFYVKTTSGTWILKGTTKKHGVWTRNTYCAPALDTGFSELSAYPVYEYESIDYTTARVASGEWVQVGTGSKVYRKVTNGIQGAYYKP